MASKNFPVPAAHLSFMAKSRTPPPGLTAIAFTSCPPTSTMVLVEGRRKWAPLAWQVISETLWGTDATFSRPYPVQHIAATSLRRT